MQQKTMIDHHFHILHFFPIDTDTTSFNKLASLALTVEYTCLHQEADNIRAFVQPSGAKIEAGNPFNGFKVFFAQRVRGS